MTKATSKQKPRRSDPRVIDLTVPRLEHLELHFMEHLPYRRGVQGCRDCALALLARAGREMNLYARHALQLGATRRDLAAVAVELMAEDCP